METPGLWNFLDHFSAVLATIGPFGLWIWHKFQKLIRERDADRQKIAALWREHGYDEWNGEERRKKARKYEG